MISDEYCELRTLLDIIIGGSGGRNKQTKRSPDALYKKFSKLCKYFIRKSN